MEQLNSTAVTPNVSSSPGLLPSPSMDPRGVVPAVVSSISFLLGLPGAISVIILKPNFQQLSSTTQTLMLNLAVSDLLTLLILPPWIYSLLYGWIFSLVACKILTFLSYCCVYGSLLTIVMLSFQRYMLVVHQQFYNQTKMRLLLVLLWLAAIIISIPPLVVRQLTLSEQWMHCKNQFSSRAQKLAVFLTECIVGFTSFFIVAFSYIQLYRKVKQTPFFNNPQTSRLVTSIIIMFICLWIPYCIADVLTVAATALNNEKLEKIFESAQEIAGALIYINSCLNPILYTFALHICKCERQVNH